MTAARVLDDESGVDVVFLESAQFYRLSREHPEFDALTATLREAVKKGTPVEVGTESIASDTIVDVRLTR